MKVTFEQIEIAKLRVESLQEKLLEQRGWEHTSSTPRPCYWLWIKTIDGKRYTLPTEMALTIESCLEEE